MGGLEFLRRLKDKWSDTEVVVMTAFVSIDTAVEAMRLGAYDYLTKPIDRERFGVVVEKALERHTLACENKQLRDRLETRTRFDQMVGESEAMQGVYSLVEMVADSDVTVLLTGESGTGKELVARAIHHKSPGCRWAVRYHELRCIALENLFRERVIRGMRRALSLERCQPKARAVSKLADGGGLLLDEVGELSLRSQVHFLRVLETKEFRRLGGTKLIKVDTRILAATNRNLEEAVKQGELGKISTIGSMLCLSASRHSASGQTMFRCSWIDTWPSFRTASPRTERNLARGHAVVTALWVAWKVR